MRLPESIRGVLESAEGKVPRDWQHQWRELRSAGHEFVFIQRSFDYQTVAHLCADDRIRYLGVHWPGRARMVDLGHYQQDLRLHDDFLCGQHDRGTGG